jgi:trehalose 6-phosphate phosphatase
VENGLVLAADREPFVCFAPLTTNGLLMEKIVDESFPDALMPLIAANHSGEKLLLLFDYDGTLTPIVEHPWLAKLAPRTRRLLGQLASLPGVHVGVLSSRRIEEVEQLVGIRELFYSGHSGIEVKLKDATVIHPAALQSSQTIEEVIRRLAAIEHVYPGAWVERKRYGFTVHYRGVAPTLVEEVHTRILGFLERWSGRLRIVEGPMAVEVVVAGTWTKGDAVRQMIVHVGEPSFALYAGDAANDKEAFDVVTARGGIALGVGPLAPPSATVQVEDPDTLVEWLGILLPALQPASVEM